MNISITTQWIWVILPAFRSQYARLYFLLLEQFQLSFTLMRYNALKSNLRNIVTVFWVTVWDCWNYTIQKLSYWEYIFLEGNWHLEKSIYNPSGPLKNAYKNIHKNLLLLPFQMQSPSRPCPISFYCLQHLDYHYIHP